MKIAGRGEKSTTKSCRTAVWEIWRRGNLRGELRGNANGRTHTFCRSLFLRIRPFGPAVSISQKLTGSSSRAESYIHFVVRDDDRRSALLFQTSVTTYQAYNEWGGMSLYSKPTAYEVSFNRPYQRGHGSGDFLFWEYSLLRFLERNGYDVTYTTDVDTHTRGHLIVRNKAFLSVGHDEYWSWEMRDALETALAFTSAAWFFVFQTLEAESKDFL